VVIGQAQDQFITLVKMSLIIDVFMIIAKIGIRMILLRIIILENVLNAGMSLMSNIIQDGTPMDLTQSKKFMESKELLHSPSKKTTHVK